MTRQADRLNAELIKDPQDEIEEIVLEALVQDKIDGGSFSENDFMAYFDERDNEHVEAAWILYAQLNHLR